MWPTITGLVGGILGAIVGAFGSYMAQKKVLELQASRQRESLAHSLAAEIESYLKIVKRRKHREAAEMIVKSLEAGGDDPFPRLMAPDDTPLGEFHVFSAIVSRIGELGPQSGRVAEFYTLAAGVR